jgi:predicted secreted protein
MKTLRRFLLLLPVLAGLTISCGGSDSRPANTPAAKETPAQKIQDITISDDKNNSTVTVGKGGQLTVRLDSNHTTGYQWLVKPGVPSNLAIAGDVKYEGPAADAPPGAGGADVFTFRATATGTQQLTLVYARSFEPNNPPAKTFTVSVVVN